MTIQEAHYDFKIKIDKVDSLKKRNFLTHEIDWILNEAYLLFIKQRFGINNVKQASFETTNKRKTDLRTLQVKSPERQPGLVPVLSHVGVFETNLSDLLYKPAVITNMAIKVKKGTCEKIIRDVKPVEHDDLNNYLTNSFYSPSLIWSRGIYVEGQGLGTEGSLYFYTNGEYDIEEVYIDYLKLPKRVWFGNYNTLDGKYVIGNPPVTFEVPEFVHNEIVDIAVVECSRFIENPDFFQLNSQKLQTNE
jgi:hypothetical protein